ncbi:MAG: NUDIX hydrolase [candidate division NC10 bacterium]|nr:NUDIX hydrolase [candidate division NC10 bacterium]
MIRGREPAYRFCPNCGGTLEQRTLRSNEPPRLVCQACGFVFFLDPKVATGAVFSVNGGVLLVQRAIEPSYGKWVFPGGYVDRGEALEAAAIREVKEECGLDVRLTRLLGVYSTPGNPVILIVYVGEVAGGTIQVDEEGLDARVFAPSEIPWDQLAFPSTSEVIRDFLTLTSRG